jgi:hypothetical protein
MPLDYHPSPDSYFLRDGVPKHITSKSLRGARFNPELEIKLIRNVARVLRVYLHYLISYLLHCAFSETNVHSSA